MLWEVLPCVRDDLGSENLEALKEGLANLDQHISNIKKFGVPPVVGINRFHADTEAELQMVKEHCEAQGVPAYVCTHWADGGAGTEAIAKKVVEVLDSGEADYKPIYPDEMPLLEKIETIAREIYRADGVTVDSRVLNQLKDFEEEGFGHFPVCMAKTQYSFSADPTLRGAPRGFTVPIREVRLSAGAEFIVAIAGDIMTMPGLPRNPAAHSIFVNEDGQIEGLF